MLSLDTQLDSNFYCGYFDKTPIRIVIDQVIRHVVSP